MSIQSSVTWDSKPKKDMSRREIRNRYVTDSSMIIVAAFDDQGFLTELVLEIYGLLATIPSLKNRKLRNNIPNPDTMGRIDALDTLFNAEKEKMMESLALSHLTFGVHTVAMKLVLGLSSNSFDDDNALSTVKDWLEPASKIVGKGKNKKQRGWGIGVVHNDSQIVSFPITAQRLQNNQSHTLIHMKRWTNLAPKVTDFYERF